MIHKIGIALLFFLPVIESLHREAAFVMLLTGVFFLSIPLVRMPSIRLDWIGGNYVLFLIIALISTIVSPSFSVSFSEFMRYFAYFLFFIIMQSAVYQYEYKKRLFMAMIVVNSIILICLAVLNDLFHIQIIHFTHINLFVTEFGHNRLSELLVFSIPISFYLYLTSRYKKIFMAMLILFSIALFLTQGRAALISLSFSFTLIYFFFRSKIRTIFQFEKKIEIISIVFLVLATSYLGYQFYYSNIKFSPNNSNLVIKGLYRPLIADQRIHYISQAARGFWSSPITGTGLDTFRYISLKYTHEPSVVSEYVHNHYIQMFAELGISGGIAFLLLSGFIIFSSFKSIQIAGDDNEVIFRMCVYIIIIASLIQSLVDFQWQFLSLFLLFWFGVSLVHQKSDTDSQLNGNKSGLILIVLYSFSFFSIITIKSMTYRYIDLLSQADSTSNISGALEILYKKLKLNSWDPATINGLAYYSEKAGNFSDAHLWYRKAILSYPSQSSSLIKSDSILYLKEIEYYLNANNTESIKNRLNELAYYYPFIEVPIHNDLAYYPVKDKYSETAEFEEDLHEYINEARQNIYKINISYDDVSTILIKLESSISH